jgi:hypothetical protein
MGGAHRPSPVDLRRSVHRPRRSRDRLRRLSSHTGTDRVLDSGTGGFGRGTDGRVQTRTNEQAEPVVTAGRRGQEIGQLLIERVVSGAASHGYEYLAVRRSAARNISTIREFYDAGFRTRPGFPAPTRRPAPAGRGRQALIDETAPNGCSASFELCRPTARATRAESALGAPGSVERLPPELTGRSGPPCGRPSRHEPRAVRQLNRALLGISGTQLRVAVHESSHRCTHSPAAVFTCLRTARAAEQRAVRSVRRRWEGLAAAVAPSAALRGEMCMTTTVGRTRMRVIGSGVANAHSCMPMSGRNLAR